MRNARTSQGSWPTTDSAEIAVVDDDESVREAMGNLLGALGYSVATFPSADAFLCSHALARTACLIADVHMPQMNGLELMRHLARAGLSIPTIFVTAHPHEALRAAALGEGAVGYLAKPVRHEELLSSLRRAMH